MTIRYRTVMERVSSIRNATIDRLLLNVTVLQIPGLFGEWECDIYLFEDREGREDIRRKPLALVVRGVQTI